MPIPLTEKQVNYLSTKGIKAAVGDIYDEATGNLTPAAAPVEETTTPLGAVGRGAIKSVLPTLGGFAAGAGSGAAAGLLGGPLAPVTVPAASIVGGVLGAMGTSALQERGLNALAKGSPEGSIATLQKLSEADAAQHPYYSMAGGFLPMAGPVGLARLGNLAAPMSRAGALVGGGIQGGIDVAQQLYGGQPFDPKQLAVSVAGGAALGGLAPGKSSALASRAKIDEALAKIQGDVPPGDLPPATTAPSFNVENYLNMSSDALRTASKGINSPEGKAMRSQAFLQDLGIKLTPDRITELYNSNNPEKVRLAIAREELPKIEAAQKLEEEKLAAIEEKKRANLGAQDVRTLSENPPEARITQVREKPGGGVEITQPPSLPSTVESARVLAAGERPQNKKNMSEFAARDKEIKRYEAQLKEYSEGTPERELGDNVLAQMREELNNDVRNFLASRGAPEAPLGITGEEAARPRVIGEIPAAKVDENARPPLPDPNTPPDAPPSGPVVDYGGTRYQKTPNGWIDTVTKRELTRDSKTAGVQDLISRIDAYAARPPEVTTVVSEPPPKLEKQIEKAKEDFAALLGKDVGASPEGSPNTPPAPAPVKSGPVRLKRTPKTPEVLPTPESPTQPTVPEPPVKTVAQEVVAKELAPPVVAPVVEPPTPVEKVVQKATIKRAEIEDPVGVVRSALRMKGKSYDELRALIKRHQNWEDYAKGKEKPDIQTFFDMLPDRAKRMVDRLWTSGAEDFPKSYKANKEVLLTPDAQKLLESQATTKKSQPVKEAPAQESPSKPGPNTLGIRPTPSNFLGAPVELVRKMTKSVGAKIKETYGALGDKFEKALEGVYIKKDQLEQPVQEQIRQVEKLVKLTPAEDARVRQYGREMFENGKSALTLTPKEQDAYRFARAVFDKTGREKAGPDAPFISAVESGTHVRRPFEMLKNFWAPARSQEVGKIINSGDVNNPRFQALKKDYIDYMMKKHGFNEEEATKLFLAQQHNTVGEGGPNPFFKGARVEAGLGLPPSWEEPNLFQGLKRYVNRHYQDLAFHQVIERDPVFAKGLNLPYGTGRDVELPAKVFHAGKEVGLGELISQDTANALKDYAGATNPNAQGIEAAMGALHGVKLGPITQISNIIQTGGRLFGVLKPSELQHIIPSFFKALTPDAYHDALSSGSVKAIRNVMPTVANDFRNTMTRIFDISTKYSGTELLSKVHDVWTDQIGRTIAQNRILLGDEAFLKKFGPSDWKTKSLDEIVNYAAARFTKQFAGSYNATDQPTALLRGVGGPWSTLFKLTRWPVGAFNRWYEHEYAALKNGNPLPVLAGLTGGLLAAGALNSLKEFLFKQKPRELSWDEYLTLAKQGKMTANETAYTLFSKVASASTTGILGDLAFAADQFANGEYPRSYNNLLLQAGSDTFTRLEQFKEGVASGAVDPLTGVIKLGWQLAQDQIQVARLFQHKEDRGTREERIARRMGYLPPSGEFAKPSLNNPFSEAGAYRDEDVGQLSNILSNKISRGARPSPPDNEIRNQRVLKDGQYLGYYDFIEATQGKAAADAARERDYNNTIKKRQMFSSALSNRR